MDTTSGEKSDNDIMMESTTSDSGMGSSSETSSLNNKSTNNLGMQNQLELSSKFVHNILSSFIVQCRSNITVKLYS